jgi:hypothetical protein
MAASSEGHTIQSCEYHLVDIVACKYASSSSQKRVSRESSFLSVVFRFHKIPLTLSYAILSFSRNSLLSILKHCSVTHLSRCGGLALLYSSSTSLAHHRVHHVFVCTSQVAGDGISHHLVDSSSRIRLSSVFSRVVHSEEDTFLFAFGSTTVFESIPTLL